MGSQQGKSCKLCCGERSCGTGPTISAHCCCASFTSVTCAICERSLMLSPLLDTECAGLVVFPILQHSLETLLEVHLSFPFLTLSLYLFSFCYSPHRKNLNFLHACCIGVSRGWFRASLTHKTLSLFCVSLLLQLLARPRLSLPLNPSSLMYFLPRRLSSRQLAYLAC